MNVSTLYRLRLDETGDILKIEETAEREWRVTRPPPVIYERGPRHNAARRRDTHYPKRKARFPAK